MTSSDIGGDDVNRGEGFPGLRKTTNNGYIYQILGVIIDGFR